MPRRHDWGRTALIIMITMGSVVAVVGFIGMSRPSPAGAVADSPPWTSPADTEAPATFSPLTASPSDAADPPAAEAVVSASPTTSSPPRVATPPAPVPVTTTTTTPPPVVNFALNAHTSASSTIRADNASSFATDGDPSTYWEGAQHGLPESLTIDLGVVRQVSRIVLRLPPSSSWPARTQTLSFSRSVDGVNYSVAIGSASYSFDPAHGNSASASLVSVGIRYLRLSFTDNSEWDAGQAAEVQVYSA